MSSSNLSVPGSSPHRDADGSLYPHPPGPGSPYPEYPKFAGPSIFISGCNRGGTTIAARLLAAHPEIANVGRGQFSEGQFIWRKKFPDWSRHRWALPPWYWYLRRTEHHASPQVVEFFRREFHQALSGYGRMLEKTPANAVRIPLIDRIFPDCHFVHVIRDGRHTTASLVARKVWLSLAPHQWVRAHRTALPDLRSLPQERVTFIRYEEMVCDPERVLGETCRRCGLRWDEPERNSVVKTAQSLLKTPECRWEAFSARQKEYVLSVIGDLQKELGYPVEP